MVAGSRASTSISLDWDLVRRTGVLRGVDWATLHKVRQTNTLCNVVRGSEEGTAYPVLPCLGHCPVFTKQILASTHPTIHRADIAIISLVIGRDNSGIVWCPYIVQYVRTSSRLRGK